jgi:hypothetical protein
MTGGQQVQGRAASTACAAVKSARRPRRTICSRGAPGGAENRAGERLSGIRELYTLTTGDSGFYGGYYPERVQFSTSAALPGLLKNALNKLVLMGWEELGAAVTAGGSRWWLWSTSATCTRSAGAGGRGRRPAAGQ